MTFDKKTIKATVLPTEHGSWAFVSEPLVFGGIWASSLRGWLTALALFLLFLCFRPLSLAVRDLSKGKSYPRTQVGLVCGGVILALAALIGLAAVKDAEWMTWMGLFSWAGAVVFFLGIGEWLKARNSVNDPGRLFFTLCGTSILGGLVALVGTGDPAIAVGIAILTLARSLPSAIYVRCCLKGIALPKKLAMVAVGSALLFAVISPPFTLLYGAVFYAILFLRALFHLLPGRVNKRTPKQVGIEEAFYGAIWAIGLPLVLRLSTELFTR